MTIIYRILSIIINVFSALVLLMLLIMLPLSIGAPALLLPVFMLACVVLYSWFSTRFRQQVLRRQLQVNKSLKDWVKVNGYVALFFSFLNISSALAVIRNPNMILDSYKEMMKQFGSKMQQEISVSTITTASYIMLVWILALAIHILWTFALIKKNESFFEKEPG